MKKVAIWVVMFFVAFLGIPLSWMIHQGMAFNVVTNAFFNSSNTTMAFYFMQWLLMILVTEMMIESEANKNTTVLQYMNVFFLIAFCVSQFYAYYLILALCIYVYMMMISYQKNKLKDDLTATIEDIKEKHHTN